jgi:alkanesulfonate monooxygenase SsuD/methylene tetrahydromethanopterin reductase-like flavin-dependent oxidoreductase (luciferase family)
MDARPRLELLEERNAPSHVSGAVVIGPPPPHPPVWYQGAPAPPGYATPNAVGVHPAPLSAHTILVTL